MDVMDAVDVTADRKRWRVGGLGHSGLWLVLTIGTLTGSPPLFPPEGSAGTMSPTRVKGQQSVINKKQQRVACTHTHTHTQTHTHSLYLLLLPHIPFSSHNVSAFPKSSQSLKISSLFLKCLNFFKCRHLKKGKGK